MKQDELEQFVDQLAKAEHDAANTIRSAELEAAARIDARRQQLAQEEKIKVETLQKQFDQERQDLLQEIEREKEQIAQETATALLRIQQSHRSVHHQLVEWLVDGVVKG